MSGSAACDRLVEERKLWRKNHPYGFIAKPETKEDGSVNLMRWQCFVPGKTGSEWEGGHYPLTLEFSEDYPNKPPTCKFPRGFLHPNVYLSGLVCMSFLGQDWKPAITVKQILMGVQDLLDKPNPISPANYELSELFEKNIAEYKSKVKLQAEEYPSAI